MNDVKAQEHQPENFKITTYSSFLFTSITTTRETKATSCKRLEDQQQVDCQVWPSFLQIHTKTHCFIVKLRPLQDLSV